VVTGLSAAAASTRVLRGATPLFGLALGAATTAAYTAAGTVIPSSARGVGFGLLTTASLLGLAISPIASGFLGATSIRSVFLLDTVTLLALAATVIRVMVTTPLTAPPTPQAAEEI